MRQFGIDPGLLGEGEALIPFRQLVYLFEEVAERLGRYDFGLLMANNQDLSVLGPLAVAMQNSKTIEEAQRCAAEHQSPALKYEVQIGDREACLGLTVDLVNMPYHAMAQAEDFVILFTHHCATNPFITTTS